MSKSKAVSVGSEPRKALYRKYRSKRLEEIVGQSHITSVLARAIAKGHISHAYLLTGPKGVGKTSIARILAHEINGLDYSDDASHLDIIEIDAASNNGVEDVRDLREKVRLAPLSAKRKVYIIDEVHMLSKPAFNALLKTLEEPPAHVVFILATTDVHKLPDTVISRTQRYSFRSITTEDMVKHLRVIADKESLAITDDALLCIAEQSKGSFRDSINTLDQLTSATDHETTVERTDVEQLFGLVSRDHLQSLVAAVKEGSQTIIIELLTSFYAAGGSPTILAEQLITALQQDILSEPRMLSVIESLLDVSSSPLPETKLLISLLGTPVSTAPKAKKTVAERVAVAPELTALVQEAVVPKPSETRVVETIAKPTEKSAKPKKQQVTDTHSLASFDWDTYAASVKEASVALGSIIVKCKGTIQDSQLLIYAGNAFYKKKLDDAKYLTILHDCLSQHGLEGVELVTLPTQLPPKDSQAAAVAAIMGGGEEVSLDDSV